MKVRETLTGAFDLELKCIQRSRSSCDSAWTTLSPIVSMVGSTQKKHVESTGTPGYQKAKRDGSFLPINPFYVYTLTRNRIPGTASVFWSNGTCTTADVVGPIWTGTDLMGIPPSDPAKIQYVVNAAAAESRSGAIDALTTLAEMPQTVSMVSNRFNNVMNLGEKLAHKANSIWRSNRRKGDVVATFSNLWLEYRYGWLPAVSTVQDGIKAFESKVTKGSIVNGTATASEDLRDSEVIVDDGGGFPITIRNTVSGSRTYRGFAYSKVTAEKGMKARLDPLVTAWELVPFSFVCDWFIDINSYLQAVTPVSGAELMGTGYSLKEDVTWTQSWSRNFDSDGVSGAISGVRTEQTIKSYYRTSYDVGLPVLYPRINQVRATDLAALMFGRIRTIAKILHK